MPNLIDAVRTRMRSVRKGAFRRGGGIQLSFDRVKRRMTVVLIAPRYWPFRHRYVGAEVSLKDLLASIPTKALESEVRRRHKEGIRR